MLVDDSPIACDLIGDELRTAGFQVVTAHSAVELGSAVELHRPDLMLIDVCMPGPDGFSAVEEVMSTRPTPILMLTGHSDGELAALSFRALELGALDLVIKPSLPEDYAALIESIPLLAEVPVVYRRARRSPGNPPNRSTQPSNPAGLPLPMERRSPKPAPAPKLGRELLSGLRAVAIATSTGGPGALIKLLKPLPRSFPLPILLVQHIAPGFDWHLSKWLKNELNLEPIVACEGLRAKPGQLIIAPCDRHLRVSSQHTVSLDPGSPVDGHRPSGTILLQSVARAFGSRALGIVLTGMGRDGAKGLLAMREAGALTIAQDSASAIVDGMPRVARELGAAQRVLAPEQIGSLLLELADHSKRRVL